MSEMELFNPTLKIRKLGWTLVLFFLSSCATANPAGAKKDVYTNFADLAAHEKENQDYTITVLDREAKVTVLALHGGRIDTDTQLIATPLAGQDWNLYVFQGVKLKNNYDLHLTSAHFDEPRALALVSRSQTCLSIHGHRSDIPRICLGGANTNLRAKVAHALESAALSFKTELLCPGLEGTSPTNPVNQCQNGGVQLEFSSSLRTRLFSDPALLQRTVEVIRSSFSSQE